MPEFPFTDDQIAHVLEEDPSRAGVARRRESASLEFKQNYRRMNNAEYAKTMAAFANAKGGYIIFGVEPQPHVLSGMTNQQFRNFDPGDMTGYLNDMFSPAIEWDHLLVESSGKQFGLFYVHEAATKPIICHKNAEDSQRRSVMKNGDVFFRYSGRSDHIRAAEMQQIIEKRLASERQSFQDYLQRISTISPENSVVMDLEQGTAVSSTGQLHIEESLLEKVKFIRQGRFDPAGDPALRVIGDLQVESTSSRASETVVDPA